VPAHSKQAAALGWDLAWLLEAWLLDPALPHAGSVELRVLVTKSRVMWDSRVRRQSGLGE